MKKDMVVKLKGITQHGKNRIHQHGEFWVLETLSNFRGQRAMSLRSMDKTLKVGGENHFDGRWVLLHNDPNFEWFIMEEV